MQQEPYSEIGPIIFLPLFCPFLSNTEAESGLQPSLPRRDLGKVASGLLFSQIPKFWDHRFPGELTNYIVQKTKKELVHP